MSWLGLFEIPGTDVPTPPAGKVRVFVDADGNPAFKDDAGVVHSMVGANGQGVPAGGTTGQVPVKASGADFDTAWTTLDAGSVGAQPANANLTGLSALTPADDQSIYYNGATWATYSLTAAGRTLLAAATQATQRSALQLGTAAIANTGQTNVGDVPVISTNNLNTSLLIVASGRAATFEGQGAGADGDDQIQMNITARADLSVANATEKRICFMGFTTNGPTPGNRGGAYYIAMKGDGTNTLTRRFYMDRNGHMQPGVTNVQDIGQAAMAWRQVYALNPTISTSDARAKTDPRQLRDAEFKAASAIARLPAVWRWLSRVHGDENCEPEGREARKHFGPTVQAAIAVMEANGLDPFAYSFICYDEWEALPEQWHDWPAQEAVLDDDGNEIEPAVEAGRELVQEAREAGDRYSFRKEELLCFIVRALAQEIDGLSDRVAALEAGRTP